MSPLELQSNLILTALNFEDTSDEYKFVPVADRRNFALNPKVGLIGVPNFGESLKLRCPRTVQLWTFLNRLKSELINSTLLNAKLLSSTAPKHGGSITQGKISHSTLSLNPFLDSVYFWWSVHFWTLGSILSLPLTNPTLDWLLMPSTLRTIHFWIYLVH